MIKTTLSLGVIICLSLAAKAQWTPVTSGVTAKIDAIHFIDSQKGYCSGSSTYTLETTDGGNSWTVGTSQPFRDFGFYDNTYGYGASTVGHSMARTTNGGLSWTSITPPTSNSLWGVAATSPTTAYFVGTGGVLWKTTNGGATVTVGNSGTTELLTDIVFTNTTTGYLAVQTGIIKKSTNSGTTWSNVYTISGVVLTEMCFVDDNTGFVVGSKGKVIKTTNAGLNWDTITTNSGSYLQGVDFYDANHGIVVGIAGVIFYTNNGGATWSAQNSGTSENLFDVRMLSATSAIVTGDNGTILKNNNIIMGVEYDIRPEEMMFSPNPAKDLIAFELAELCDGALLSVYNIQGQLLLQHPMLQAKEEINISSLQAGVYILKAEARDNTIVKKFIKE